MSAPSRRWWLAALGLAGGCWAAVAGVTLLHVARDLREGRDAAAHGAAALDLASVRDGRAVAPLGAASAHFVAARRGLRSPAVAPLRLLPIAGRQLRALDAMSNSAAVLADTAATTIQRTSTLVDAPRAAGPDRLALVDELDAAVRAAGATVEGIDLGPGSALLGPAAAAHRELAGHVATARTSLADAHAALAALSDLLRGRRRYLLVGANNAEMRAGSGMWLTGGVLSGGDGNLHLGRMTPLYESAKPQSAVVIEDAALRSEWGWMHPEREWRSLMASPRLAPSADLALQLWRAAGNEPVDGVIVVDAAGLAALVAATGPVQVHGRNLAAADVEQELLHDQYLRDDDPTQAARHEALADVAAAAIDALAAGHARPIDLAQQLSSAAAGRHVLAWSPDPATERGWEAAGVDGAMGARSLAVSLLNRGGNKLDWFTHVSARITTAREGADTRVTVTVAARVEPPAGEPSYVVGPYPGLGTVAGEYRGVLAVNAPATARDLRLPGAALFGGDGPTWMAGREVRITADAPVSVVATFVVPGTHGRIVVEPSARVPAVDWSFGSETWQDAARHEVWW